MEYSIINYSHLIVVPPVFSRSPEIIPFLTAILNAFLSLNYKEYNNKRIKYLTTEANITTKGT